MTMAPAEQPAAGLLRGVVDCVDRAHLEARLNLGKPLRIKFGVDPSAPDIHLGHTVPMRLLRRWQEQGHLPVLIIGDYTARIGDPTGRSATRPQLSAEQVEANARTYLDQLFRVVDQDRCEVRHQSEWFSSFQLDQVLRLARTTTVAQLLQRSDFDQRMRSEQPVGVHELFYPLLQGYDSVAVEADVELGGTDQLFNLLRGREVQQAYGVAPQDIVTVPLLLGLDGQRKMSKSLGNAVAVADPPGQQFGQLMSIPDFLIVPYLDLLTDTAEPELARLRAGLEDGSVHPRALKAAMAEQVVAQFHGPEAARAASREFDAVFRDHQLPDSVPELRVGPEPTDLRALLVLAGLAGTRSEAARLIDQGGVRVDGRQVLGWSEPLTPRDRMLVQVGKRRVVRLLVT